jgi:CHASE2 domain-containing sensor protein/two-component sensor histidine kinase
MVHKLWSETASKYSVFGVGFLRGMSIITFVILMRVLGTLQFFEWAAFDTFMRWRPNEKMDERILIVGINENDIKQIKQYPIPDRDIAALLRKLQTYNPAVIGLDIVRDLPQEPGYSKFVSVLKDNKNLITIDKVLPDRSGFIFNAPPNLPQAQVGFVDAIIDIDSKQRRSLLATSDAKGEWRFSLALKLAERYLATQGFSLENVENDPYGMRFNNTQITRFQSHDGGYINADARGSQILINFRKHSRPFHLVSLTDIQKNKVSANLIRDKIVLIAMTSSSAKDYVNSAAIDSENPALIYGVEIQAHVVSQIVSSVIEKRTMINVWADKWEYLWIIIWGLLGLSLGSFIRYPLIIIVYATVASAGLIAVSYSLLIIGFWVPVVPSLLVLLLNSIALAAFFRYDEALRSLIQERQLIIDQTFSAIHSYPLQTLSLLLREIPNKQEIKTSEILLKLQQLNQELRDVYDLVKRETVTDLNSVYLGQEQRLDMQQPLHELLHEVYEDVLLRDYPNFKKQDILKIVAFESMDERNLSIKHKRGLCRFLEEALCNIGKYAQETDRIEVICGQKHGQNIIRVVDNGSGFTPTNYFSSSPGFGTQQAQNLAKQLGGKFERFSNSPGVICQLTWSVKKFWFWRFLKSD